MNPGFLRRVFVILLSVVLLASCAKGPAPIQAGSPAFFWGAAQSAYASADYVKTNDNLGQLTNSENEFTARARVWQMVVSAGLARGYNDLADAYEQGRKFTRKDQAPFREQVRLSRGSASQAALLCGETFRRFLDADKNEKIVIAFEFPKAVEEPPQLARLGKGLLATGVEADTMQAALLQRGVRAVAAAVAGTPDDFVKAADGFKSGTLPRADFLAGMAAALYDQSTFFGPKKLDEPQRMKAFCILAQTALGQAPQTRQNKELQKKIQKALGPGKS